jgi:ATP-dependent Clp protease ATP-binding subunit ClpA
VLERFTERARRVLVLAQEEARLLNHGFIGTEHLLLGLIAERDGIAAEVLAALDVTPDSVRQRVEAKISRSGTPPTGSPPFTLRAKKVLERSLKEALALRHKYIGPEHLLLGLVALDEGIAMAVLADLGIEAERVRNSVLEKVEPGDDPPTFTSDDRLYAVQRLVTSGSGGGRPRPYPLNGWRRLWYGRIVRLPFIFYPVAWFDNSVPGTRGHLRWLLQPREFIQSTPERSSHASPVSFERFTGRASRVMEFAQEEALLLSHSFIGTEHLLLGLLHDGAGVAFRALTDLGISLEAARDEVKAIIGDSGTAPTGPLPLTPRTKRALRLAQMEAARSGVTYIGAEHVLLGLVREGDGVAAQVLISLGADLRRVRQQVLLILSQDAGEK